MIKVLIIALNFIKYEFKKKFTRVNDQHNSRTRKQVKEYYDQ